MKFFKTIQYESPVGGGLKYIDCIPLQRGKTPPKWGGRPGYDTKLHPVQDILVNKFQDIFRMGTFIDSTHMKP